MHVSTYQGFCLVAILFVPVSDVVNPSPTCWTIRRELTLSSRLNINLRDITGYPRVTQGTSIHKFDSFLINHIDTMSLPFNL
jgi:hypothetical protein